jgi:hypothetical protein
LPPRPTPSRRRGHANRERPSSRSRRARLRWISERADAAWFFANIRNTGSIELHHRFGFEEITRDFSFPGLAFQGGEGILFRARLRP